MRSLRGWEFLSTEGQLGRVKTPQTHNLAVQHISHKSNETHTQTHKTMLRREHQLVGTEESLHLIQRATA